jgi:hypothetical protein
MPRNSSKVLLVSIISLSLIRPARAESIDTAGKQIYAGIGVVAAALVVGGVLIILHDKHKTTTITGCVASPAGGMTLTDDKDKQVYALSGTPAGVKPGDRMTLDGKRHGKMFEARSMIKDLGVCQQ